MSVTISVKDFRFFRCTSLVPIWHLIDIFVILALNLPVSQNNNGKKSRNIIKRQESERKRARVRSALGAHQPI